VVECSVQRAMTNGNLLLAVAAAVAAVVAA